MSALPIMKRWRVSLYARMARSRASSALATRACWTLKSLTVMITSSSMLISLCRAEVFTTFRLFLAMLYLPFLTPQSTSGMETLTDTISCCMGCLYASPNFSATWLKPTLALMLALKRDSFFVLSTVCSASSTS